MGNWGLIVPLAATNYVQNPAFTNGVDTWAAHVTETATGSRTRGVTYALQGFHSYQINKTSAADTGDYGIVYTYPDMTDFLTGVKVAISAFVNIETGAMIRLQANFATPSGGLSVGVSVAGPYTGRITALSAALPANATGGQLFAYVEDDTNGAFWITGIQTELTQVTTYFDGFTPDCDWKGEFGNSESTRPLTARKGGIETDFDDYNYFVTSHSGLASAETGNKTQEFTTSPGGYLQNQKSPIRSGTLVGDLIGESLVDLHAKRKILNDLMTNPQGGVEFTIYCEGSGDRLYLDAILDSGFGSFKRNGFSEKIAIRLRSLSPYWYRGYQSSAELDFSNFISGYQLISYYTAGVWYRAGSVVASPTVNAVKFHQGKIYVGGSFGVVDSVANTANLAVFDGTSWTALGTGVNGVVRAIEVSADGNVYVGGDFTSAGGVANTDYIARWDGAAWNALDGGVIDGSVYALKQGKALGSTSLSTFLYIGGDHPTPHRVASYALSSDSISAEGTGIPTLVRTLDIQAGNLYVGGDFVNIGGNADMSYIAQWDGTTYTALGTGANNSVYTVLAHSDGSVYIGGTFTTLSGDTIERFGQWGGTAWFKLGAADYSLSSGIVKDIIELTNGEVFLIGDYATTVPNQPIPDYASFWNSTNYSYLGGSVDNAGTRATLGGVYDLIHCTGISGRDYGGSLSVEYAGTTETPALFRFESFEATTFGGPFIEGFNYQVNTGVYYVAYLEPGETLLIGAIEQTYQALSTQVGNVLKNMLANSAFGDFRLLPGANTVLASQSTVSFDDGWCSLHWTDLYWSPDGL